MRLTVFPDFWKLYYRLWTKVVGDRMERGLLKLWLGEEVRVLGLVAGHRLSGERYF